VAALFAAPALIGPRRWRYPVSRSQSVRRPGGPITTETRCLTAIQNPGQSAPVFDISWVDADRSEYYLSDRSNSGIDVIDTKSNTFKRTIGGFVGVKLKRRRRREQQYLRPRRRHVAWQVALRR